MKLRKLVLVAVVGLVAVGITSLYLFGNYLNQNFAKAQSISADFSNPDYYTILYVATKDFSSDPVVIEKVLLVVVDADNKKILSYQLDADYKVNYGGSYGEAELSKAFAYGGLNNEEGFSGGVTYVNRILDDFFAFPIDKYVYTDERYDAQWSSLLNKGEFLPIVVSYLRDVGKPGNYTNLKLNEVYKLSQFIAALPDDRKLTINQTSFSPEEADGYLRELTINSKFAHEEKSVAILNASNTTGRASLGARYVNNLGGRVVSVDNASAKFGESFIVSDTPDDYSTRLLAKAFRIGKVIDKQLARQYVVDSELYRAEIIVLLAD